MFSVIKSSKEHDLAALILLATMVMLLGIVISFTISTVYKYSSKPAFWSLSLSLSFSKQTHSFSRTTPQRLLFPVQQIVHLQTIPI